MKKLRYLIEAILAYAAYGILWIIPIDVSSFLLGKTARYIGPFLSISNVARKNLMLAFPELGQEVHKKILSDMWENIGRVIGEFPHIPRLCGKDFDKRVSVSGLEHMQQYNNQQKPAIVFSGHFANWELAPRTAYEKNMPLVLIYRHANNQWVDKLIHASRKHSHAGMYNKDIQGAREVLRTIRQGNFVGLLVDQKMNDGIKTTFFGHTAMSAPAMAELAIKYNVPLIPARVIRTHGANFHVEVCEPIDIEGKTEIDIIQAANDLMESWIRQYPTQWFWLHKRWPKAHYHS